MKDHETMLEKVNRLIAAAKKNGKKATTEDTKHKWKIIEEEFKKAKRDLETN